MRLAEPLGLSYTTAPLTQDLIAAGPAALQVRLSSTAPSTAIWAVISDVGPDGIPHPLGVGRLSTDYPDIDPARSLKDPVTGDIVQPYGEFGRMTPATPLSTRRYHVEFWPLGNVFRAGHRVRLHLVGQSLASLPRLPALNTVTLGGSEPSRLLLPVTPAEPATATAKKVAKSCRSRRVFTVHVPSRYRKAMRGGTVRVAGKRVGRLSHTHTSTRIDLRRFGGRTVHVTVTMRLTGGRTRTDTRTYHPCR